MLSCSLNANHDQTIEYVILWDLTLLMKKHIGLGSVVCSVGVISMFTPFPGIWPYTLNPNPICAIKTWS